MSENSEKKPSNSGGDWRSHVQNMVKCCEVITQSIRGLDQRLFCVNEQVNSIYIVKVMRLGEKVGSIPRNKQNLHPEVDWVYWKDTRK